MTSLSCIALAVAGIAAVGDWWAVARDSKKVEYLAKPLTLIALLVVAVSLDPADEARRALFVVALVFSLGGDVFLMLPRDLFLPGLASFFAAHLAYVAGFIAGEVSVVAFFAAAVLLSVLASVLLAPVVRTLRVERPRLVVPVFGYAAVITAMVAAAVGHGHALAIAGALSFYLSDFLIARSRFVDPFRGDRLTIMVTYHLGQAALIGSLLG